MRPFNEGDNFLNLVKQSIPDFVETDYPTFVEFVKAFVSFLEQQRQTSTVATFPDFGPRPTPIVRTDMLGGPLYEARKFFDYRDMETTIDDFISHFMAMYGGEFPLYSYIPKERFLQSLREFYTNKGTVSSYKWFFRAFFNMDSDVYFPREDILRASDGTWVQPITLKVSEALEGRNNSDVLRYYVGQRVKTDTGTAVVENVLTQVVGQQFSQFILVNEVYLKADSIQGTFTPGQILTNIDSPDIVVETRILPVITDLIIETGGSNYAPGDLVHFSEGPAGGYGYGALARVKQVASTSLNSVIVDDGGDGYLVGLPVEFISTTGQGASAVVAEIVYGEWLTEDGGFFLDEHQTPDQTDRIVLEDRNTIILELLIDPFVNATATVTGDSADYGAATGVTQLDGTTIDSEIEIFLAASDEKPFMHPWVFTNNNETTAVLANVEVMVGLSTNTFFANTDSVFVINGPLDVTTNIGTSNVSANVIISDISLGNNQNILFLQDIIDINKFHSSTYIKANGAGSLQLGRVTTDGTSNVFGNNTIFTKVLQPNTHIRFDNGTQSVVKQIVNNTFMSVYGLVPALVQNTFSIIPTGLITQFTPQAQRFYGKITKVQLLTQGRGYTAPPFVTADSISARAQQLYHLNPDDEPVDTHDPLNSIDTSSDQVTLFKQAIMEVGRDAGQISKVSILNAGVNYLDAASISITATHGNHRVGDEAQFTPVIGSLSRYPGSFTTSRGFLSSDKFLQDSTFYNDFVYVVKVGESVERYKNMLLRLLHPAGFRLVGRVVIIDTVSLDLNAEGNPDFAPSGDLGLIITGGGSSDSDTDILYILDLGDTSVPRTRERGYVPVRGSVDMYINSASFLTSTEYRDAVSCLGMTPQMYWSLANGTSLISNGTSTFQLAPHDMTDATDGPTHEFRSLELTANGLTGASNTFSNAVVQLFNNRADVDKQLRGALTIWFHPNHGLPSSEQVLFDVTGWLKITLKTDGTIKGYFGSTNITTVATVSQDGWNMVALSYTGADTEFNEGLDLDLPAGELKLYLNGYNSTANIATTLDVYPSGITLGTAPGRYGQAAIYIEPVTPEFVYELWNAGLRDGTEVIDVVQTTGSEAAMIYPWYNQTISVLANDAISTAASVNQPIAEAPEQHTPASGLD